MGDEPSPATGVLVEIGAKEVAVLTAGHVWRYAGGTVRLRFPNGQTLVSSEGWGDKDGWDLAGIAVSAVPGVVPIRIAANAPAQGETVHVAGYGDGRWWARSARVLGYARPKDRGDLTYNEIVVSTRGRSGDSGGPIFNGGGELVGIISASDYQAELCGPCCRPIRSFLGRLFAAISARRQERIAQRSGSRGSPTPGPEPYSPDVGVTIPSGNPDYSEAPPWQPPIAEDPIPGPLEDEAPLPIAAAGPGCQGCDLAGVQSRLDALEGRLERDVSAVLNLRGVDNAAAGVVQQRLDEMSARLNESWNTEPALVSGESSAATIQNTVAPQIAASVAEATGALWPWLLAALGLGGATPAVLAAGAVWRLARSRKEQKEQAAAEPAITAAAQPAATETAAPKVVVSRVVREKQQYVPYEAPCPRCRATLMSFAEYVRRYPGARSAVEVMERFRDQYESGLEKPLTN